jgi:predicted RNA-binding protein associated with RNAse of E/G family
VTLRLGHSDEMLLDHDFHPDEDSVRVFTTPPPGVVLFDDEVAVTEVGYDGVILRHYAFAKHWFKVNVTTDRHGGLIETGDAVHPFAFNCDITTPMERDGNSTFAVDLFIDVLIRRDLSSFYVGDEDEFEQMAERDLMSAAEQRAAKTALSELLALIEGKRLLPWLNDLVPFGPCDPPAAPPMERREIPHRMKPFLRSTW